MIDGIGPFGASPTLGVLYRTPAPEGLVTLLTEARRWCTVIVLTKGHHRTVDAVVASSPGLATSGQLPMAVWVDSLADLESEAVGSADVVVSGDAAVVEGAGGRGLFVPSAAGVNRTAVLVVPFVRARLRAARGLPSPLIVECDEEGWAWFGGQGRRAPELVNTALAVASAAVVADGPALVSALAWGTPCVTDGRSAENVGAEAGRQVMVADTGEERQVLARSVAADDRLAARLSWAGRALVEERHAPAVTAARLVRRLGLASATRLPGPPRLAAQLSELGTRDGAVVAGRVSAATAALTGAKG